MTPMTQMTLRLTTVTLATGLFLGVAVPAFASPWTICLATSDQGSGHEGNYTCVGVEGVGHIG